MFDYDSCYFDEVGSKTLVRFLPNMLFLKVHSKIITFIFNIISKKYS